VGDASTKSVLVAIRPKIAESESGSRGRDMGFLGDITKWLADILGHHCAVRRLGLVVFAALVLL
jgi:hypothetical protein